MIKVKALLIKNLKKTYKNGFTAVKGIDLTVENGDLFGLLGPNGAGKTTTIGIITDLVIKTSGKISVFGIDFDENREEAKKLIGVVPQEFNLSFFDTIFDILVCQAGFYGIPKNIAKQRAEKYLRQMDLWDKKDQKAMQISGGMKRKLMVIRAVMHDPKLVIFDEPTAGLDVEARRTMWQFMKDLNKEGKTIILTTHYLEEVEQLCKNIAIIHNGKILKNTTVKELITTMDEETFVLDLKEKITENDLPKKFNLKLIDSHTIEATIPRTKNINNLINELTKKKINVMSMRNKTNRLEELFVRITK